jgi:DNA-binding transcriptional LysR family regulator
VTSTRAFDWTLIRTFLAVIDNGSVYAAARQLGAHQPTLSRHVAELERQLGRPLFERTGRGVVPTKAALSILGSARRMEAGALALARDALETEQLSTGTVRVAASEVTATWLLPQILARLQDAEPRVQIELVVSNSVSNLLRREADIAVRMRRPAQASLVAKKLGNVRMVVAASRTYLARSGTPATPADLLRHRLVGYERDPTILRGFSASGFRLEREAFAVRTDNQLAYGRLVSEGAGIGFVAEYNLAFWPDVVMLVPELKIPSLPCWLVVHREIRGNSAIRRVYDVLAQEIPRELTRLVSQASK